MADVSQCVGQKPLVRLQLIGLLLQCNGDFVQIIFEKAQFPLSIVPDVQHPPAAIDPGQVRGENADLPVTPGGKDAIPGAEKAPQGQRQYPGRRGNGKAGQNRRKPHCQTKNCQTSDFPIAQHPLTPPAGNPIPAPWQSAPVRRVFPAGRAAA